MEPIRILHVEDDKLQRALVAHFLVVPEENKYVVTAVESEDEAVGAFQRGNVDLVLLDYQLAQGNGLSCLRQLRKLDPIVPVIAVSGIATSAVAAELIEAGADDYLSKQSLDQTILLESMQTAIARAHGFRAAVDNSSRGNKDDHGLRLFAE